MQTPTAADTPFAAAQTFTLPQFMGLYNVPRTTFYELAKQGRAPRTLRIGRRVLISRQAAADWIARMEAETAAQHNQPVAA